MTKEELISIFQEEDLHDEEYIEFDRVEDKRSRRPDLHAWMLLDQLVPGDGDLVDTAEHDQIWLGVDLKDLAKVVTKDQVIELIRCGVILEDGRLTMNV